MNGKRTTPYFLPAFWLILLITLSPLKHAWGAGAYRFVKPGGTGGSCSRETPCHFSVAITWADPGDIIIFQHGEYTRTTPLPPSPVISYDKEIYLQGGWDGSPTGELVINPDFYPSVLNGKNERAVISVFGPIRTKIVGFTIQNGKAADSPMNCNGLSTTGCGGGIYADQAAALIEGNKIVNNEATEDEGSGGGIHLENPSETIVRDNIFQGNQAKKGGGLNLSNGTSIISIGVNHFISNTAVSRGGGVHFLTQTDLTLTNNTFDNNEAPTGSGLAGEGPGIITRNDFQNHVGGTTVNLEKFQGDFIANLLINNFTGLGLQLGGGAPPFPLLSNNIIAKSGTVYGLWVSGGTLQNPLNALLEHNTIVGEGNGTAVVALGPSLINLNNNILSGYPTGIINQATTSIVTARHTLFDESVTTPGPNVNFINTVTGDPAFKNPEAGDYHIRLTSAARDAGTSAIVTTEDIDGDPRPIGSAPDIGADEYKASGYLFLPLIRK